MPDCAFKLADFDRYVEEHGIPEEDYPAAFALWIAEITSGRVPRFEKVEREEPADGGRDRGRRPLGASSELAAGSSGRASAG